MFNSIKDLKKWYFIFFETGLILALLILLSAFKLQFGNHTTYEPVKADQNIPTLEEIPNTEHQETPPPPPKPQVFTEVPDDHIFEDPIDDIPDFSIDEAGNMPIEHRQAKNDKEETIFVPFEEGPEIIGGLASIYQQINYPKKARLAGIEGTVVVEFTVTKKGSVEDAEVIRGIGGGCDKEALRVVKQITFKPARQRENHVTIRMRIPIRFQLRN